MPLTGESLDERWLDFLKRTAAVSKEFPEFASVRQVFFKRQFVRGEQMGAQDRIKSAVRRFARREPSSVPEALGSQVDVAFWLDSPREVLTEAVLPVWRQLKQMGARTCLICSPSVASSLDLSPDEVALFRAGPRGRHGRKWSIIFDAISRAVPEASAGDGRQIFFHVAQESDGTTDEIVRILTRVRPRLLVLPVDQVLPGSAACRAARDQGIETLVLLHGAVSAYNAPVVADRMAVWGNVSADQMHENGVEHDRLIVLGSPRHDSYSATRNHEAAGSLRKALGLSDLPILTFFSNGNDLNRNSREAVETCAAWLEEAAETFGDSWNFVVRLHPNEDGGVYKGTRRLRVFKDDVSSITTLAGSDVVAALCSTVLSEALLLSRPVLQFYADGWPRLADNWERGLAVRVPSAQGLLEQVRALGSTASLEEMCRIQRDRLPELFANHGRSTQAVADYLIGQNGTATDLGFKAAT